MLGLFVVDQTTLAVAVIFLFAGTVKGTVGIGLPTVSVGIMSQFFPPHFAIAVVVFPILFSNLWQVLRSGVGLDTLRRYWRLVSLLAVTLLITTYLTAQISTEYLLGFIGTAIVVFAVSSLAKTPPELPEGRDKSAQVITGIAAGILGGFTSIWAPPLVTYLIARRVDPEEFVRAVGLFIFIGAIPLTIGFWQTGLLNGATAPVSMAMIVPTLIGFSVGEVIRRRIHPDHFRTVLLWIFLIMGLNLLRRSIF